MASSTSSLSQASSHQSPSHSVQRQGLSLETLISYLVASKRSLASIGLVHRATTILAEARSAVESTTVLSARTKYLQRSIASQLKILQGVQFQLEGAARNVQAEFETLLSELDHTDKKLQQSIELLKSTKVEDAFKTSRLEGEGDETGEVKDTLHDFIDNKPVQELDDAIKAAIDEVQSAKKDMDRSLATVEDDIHAINEALGDRTVSSSPTRSISHEQHIPVLLKLLDKNAKGMAENLESLVNHFDLCVTAIKHTEGGGEAVAAKFKTEDLPEGIVVEDFEAPAQPMNEDERVEMLQVLETDAVDVDDVVMEIQSSNANMEAQLDQIMLWKERKDSLYDEVTQALKLLEKTGAHLAGHINESSRFASKWAEEKHKIEDGMVGMQDLCDVYDSFLDAYDGLIVEVARRKSIKKQMEKIVLEAHAKLDRLYQDDLAERETFRVERGNYLPMDIWHGLASAPPKFAVSRIDEDDGSVPDLPRKTVEDALRRLKASSF